MWDAWDVDIVWSEDEEEGLVFVGFDEVDGLASEGVGHIFVSPASGMATRHPADAADAIDDGHVVAVGVFEFEEVWVFCAGGVGADFFLVADFDGIVGVEVNDVAIVDVNGGDAVAGGGHDEAVVEAEVEWAGFDFAVPVGAAIRAEAEVPLADDGGFVAGGLHDGADGGGAGFDGDGGVAWGDGGAGLLAPRVDAGEESAAGGRASGGGGVAVGEHATVGGDFVEVGGFGVFGALAA